MSKSAYDYEAHIIPNVFGGFNVTIHRVRSGVPMAGPVYETYALTRMGARWLARRQLRRFRKMPGMEVIR